MHIRDPHQSSVLESIGGKAFKFAEFALLAFSPSDINFTTGKERKRGSINSFFNFFFFKGKKREYHVVEEFVRYRARRSYPGFLLKYPKASVEGSVEVLITRPALNARLNLQSRALEKSSIKSRIVITNPRLK